VGTNDTDGVTGYGFIVVVGCGHWRLRGVQEVLVLDPRVAYQLYRGLDWTSSRGEFVVAPGGECEGEQVES